MAPDHRQLSEQFGNPEVYPVAEWRFGTGPSCDRPSGAGALFPQGPDGPCDGKALSSLLLDLMKRAGLLELGADGLAHPGLQELGSRVQQAAEQVISDHGISREKTLWTDPAALWYGAMAQALFEDKASGSGDGTALLLAFASDAGPYGLLWNNASSLRARDGFQGDFSAGGPFLVLMRCSLEWTRDVTVETGIVLPVLDGKHFLPVRSHLERDVCRILVKMLEFLDAQGIEATIRRERTSTGLSDWIGLKIAGGDGTYLDRNIICDLQGSGLGRQDPSWFVVTPAAIADQTFVRWLLELVGR